MKPLINPFRHTPCTTAYAMHNAPLAEEYNSKGSASWGRGAAMCQKKQKLKLASI